jgi:Arc/MetJ family transcription regulator
MVRRTTINLDMDLVSQAREILKTRNTTDTVHGALREVVRRERLRRLAERDWGMTLEDLMEMRRSRVETRPWAMLGDGDLSDLWSAPSPNENVSGADGSAVDSPKKAA